LRDLGQTKKIKVNLLLRNKGKSLLQNKGKTLGKNFYQYFGDNLIVSSVTSRETGAPVTYSSLVSLNNRRVHTKKSRKKKVEETE